LNLLKKGGAKKISVQSLSRLTANIAFSRLQTQSPEIETLKKRGLTNYCKVTPREIEISGNRNISLAGSQNA